MVQACSGALACGFAEMHGKPIDRARLQAPRGCLDELFVELPIDPLPDRAGTQCGQVLLELLKLFDDLLTGHGGLSSGQSWLFRWKE